MVPQFGGVVRCGLPLHPEAVLGFLSSVFVPHTSLDTASEAIVRRDLELFSPSLPASDLKVYR